MMPDSLLDIGILGTVKKVSDRNDVFGATGF